MLGAKRQPLKNASDHLGEELALSLRKADLSLGQARGNGPRGEGRGPIPLLGFQLGQPSDVFVCSSELIGYCSYTKAIEHLGDRWSLLIVRQLGTFGPQGFNGLVTGLPGRISRSVLADRLRRLETLGLVSRADRQDPHPTYRLTAVGQGLMTTLSSLRTWADTWLPDDPDMWERDPDVVLGWLAQRADPDRVPRRSVVLELRLPHRLDRRYWLVLARGVEPYGCLTDPLLDESRYVYVEAAMPALLALARGRCDWSDAFGDGSVTAAGDPDLVNQVAEWFQSTSEHGPSSYAGGRDA